MNTSVVYQKAVNEVNWWLRENKKSMKPEEINETADKAVGLFLYSNYSSLENAVDDLLLDYDFKN